MTSEQKTIECDGCGATLIVDAHTDTRPFHINLAAEESPADGRYEMAERTLCRACEYEILLFIDSDGPVDRSDCVAYPTVGHAAKSLERTAKLISEMAATLREELDAEDDEQ